MKKAHPRALSVQFDVLDSV